MSQELVTPTAPLAKSDLAKEVKDALRYAEASLAANTLRAYQFWWNDWTAWCVDRELDPYGPCAQIAVYLGWLAEQDLSVSSIDLSLSAISRAYRTAGKPRPRDDENVRLVLAGIHRTLGVAQAQVDPIVSADLKLMVAALPEAAGRERLRVLRNRAILTCGWATGMRISNIAALQFEDLEFVETGIKVTLRRSKTDQEGVGQVVAVSYGAEDTCPVRCLKAWIDGAGIKSGPVFRTVTPDGMDVFEWAISCRQLENVIKDSARNAGLEGRFSGHSLRSGFVTSAVRAGKSIESIRAKTGHTTVDMLFRYVREHDAFKDDAAAGLI